MNNARRKVIDELTRRLDALKEEFQSVVDEEQEYFDNMPESLQTSERGQSSETAISCLDSAICSIEDALSELSNIE
jgi:division protein CdvB (Snf7/Vps24/ESCRT-III family)